LSRIGIAPRLKSFRGEEEWPEQEGKKIRRRGVQIRHSVRQIGARRRWSSKLNTMPKDNNKTKRRGGVGTESSSENADRAVGGEKKVVR